MREGGRIITWSDLTPERIFNRLREVLKLYVRDYLHWYNLPLATSGYVEYVNTNVYLGRFYNASVWCVWGVA